MNKEKVKAFCKEHKVKIAVGAGIAVSVILCAIFRKSFHIPENVKFSADKIEDVSIPSDFKVGKIKNLWNEKGYLNAIVDEITTKDLGNLGEEFVKSGLVTDADAISMVIGFLKKDV